MATFGTDLWDQIKNLEQYTQHGVAQMLGINEFIKAVSVAEIEYGKALQKAAKPFKDEIKKMLEKQEKSPIPLQKAITQSTTFQAWDKLLTGTELLGMMHIEVAEQLSTERKIIKVAAKDLESFSQERFTMIRKANDELKAMIDIMEKNHASYNKEMKEMEAIGAKYKASLKDLNITKEKQDRAKLDHDKQAQLTYDVSVTYRKSISIVNEKKRQFYDDILKVYLNDIQHKDEKVRIILARDYLLKFGTMMEGTAPKTTAIWNEAAHAFSSIDHERDSSILITCLKTGEERLPDFHFSDTQEVLKKKMVLRTVSTMEMKPETDTDDQIIAMAGKSGRKKAMEKVKSLDKEIIEVEKQRQGIESLIGAYRDLPNGKEVHQDFLAQRGDTEMKLNSLLIKKHKLHCYIAQVDNKAIPEPPTLFGNGLSDSPVSYTGSKSQLSDTSPGLGTSKPSLDLNLPLRLSTNFSATAPSLHSVKELPKVIAVYDFDAADGSQELTLRIGQILDLIQHQDDGWSQCKTADGTIGFVPTSYVEPHSE